MSSARDFLFVKKNELVAKIFTDIMRAVAAVHDWGIGLLLLLLGKNMR